MQQAFQIPAHERLGGVCFVILASEVCHVENWLLFGGRQNSEDGDGSVDWKTDKWTSVKWTSVNPKLVQVLEFVYSNYVHQFVNMFYGLNT